MTAVTALLYEPISGSNHFGLIKQEVFVTQSIRMTVYNDHKQQTSLSFNQQHLLTNFFNCRKHEKMINPFIRAL